MKDAPNHVLMNMICLAHTSREILKEGDVPIFLVVLITEYFLQLTVIVPVSYYLTSARRLIQSVYDRTFSASVGQINYTRNINISSIGQFLRK